MGFAITAAIILVVCLIAAGLVKRAEARGDTFALQNHLEASCHSQLHPDQGHHEPDFTEGSASEDFINLEQHGNP